MTSDSGRHAERGDAKQAPAEGCQSGGASRIAQPIPSPMVSSDGLIERLRYGRDVESWWALGAEAADALEANKRALSDAEMVLREARQWVEHYNLQHRTLGNVTDVLARIDTALEAMSNV